MAQDELMMVEIKVSQLLATFLVGSVVYLMAYAATFVKEFKN